MKPSVDFYVISQATPMSFACRLLEKAYHKGHKVCVLTTDQQQAHELDQLLWTYKDDSFIPHNLQGEGPTPPPAIQINFSDSKLQARDILLNLSDNIPSQHQQFRRIMHIVTSNPEQKNLAREHFKYYKQQNYSVNTHQI